MSKDSAKPNQAVAKVPRPRPVVPWNPWLAVAAVLFIYVFTQFVAIELVAIYPALKHWPAGMTNDWLTNNISAQFFYVLLAEAMSVALVWLYLHAFKLTFRVIGLTKAKLEDIPYALAGLAIYFPTYVIIVTLLSSLLSGFKIDQTQQIGFQNPAGGSQLVLVFISLVILPPIVEEIIFRGLLFTSLRSRMSFLWTALAVSALFALPHLLEGGNSGLLWIAGVDTFILSLVLCWLREKTGRLYAGMGLHALKNFIAFASLFIFHFH